MAGHDNANTKTGSKKVIMHIFLLMTHVETQLKKRKVGNENQTRDEQQAVCRNSDRQTWPGNN